MIKVIAFDLFGTVFDLESPCVEHQEIKDYIHHVRNYNRVNYHYRTLTLPEKWQFMKPFSDSRYGIELLRKKYTVVSCSNCPLGLQIKMCKNSGIQFDGMIPLELSRTFKPNPLSYSLIHEILDVLPEEVMMVTGNPGSPDIDGAKAVGQKTLGIRKNEHKEGFNTILEMGSLMCSF